VTLYVDASAILKLHVHEADSAVAARILGADPDWATGRHTYVEVRRNLARILGGPVLEGARATFEEQWARLRIVELDGPVCERAARLAEHTGARTLDALHLGAAEATVVPEAPVVTFDPALASAARSLGWEVLGAAQ
jgi:predicted nucleic acid-binding protein